MAALQPKPQSATELPRFDGQLMNLGGWLRALRQQEHLLPSDLSYFTKTGAQVMNNGKVAVVSAHHALLILHGGLLAKCDFSMNRMDSGSVASKQDRMTDLDSLKKGPIPDPSYQSTVLTHTD